MFGGSERILIDRAARLRERVVVCCPPGPLAAGARAAGLPVRELTPNSLLVRRGLRTRARALADGARLALELRAATTQLRPDVVVLWGMRAALAAIRPSRRHPPQVFVHNDLLPAGALAQRIIRHAARRCDAVAVLSGAIAAQLPGTRCDTIPAGVDLRVIEASPVPSKRRAVILGAIVGWKRPDLALEVVARAASALPDLALEVVGAPLEGDPGGVGLLAALRDRAASADLHGRVTFAGQVADAAAALRSASCLLHCSDAEPFGLALVEALAAGRPVVAPSAGGALEIVDSSCGRLYRPGDPGDGAAALVEVLSDHAQTQALGRHARARAEARFDSEDAALRFKALLDRVRS